MGISRPLSQTFLRLSFEPSLRLMMEVAPALEREWESAGLKLRVVPPNLATPFVWGEELGGIPTRYVSLTISTATYGEMGFVYKGFEDFYPRAEQNLRLVIEKAFGESIPWKTMTVGYVDIFAGENLKHLTPKFVGITAQPTRTDESFYLQGVFPESDARILIEISKLPNTQGPAYRAKWFYESEITSWDELRGKALRGREVLKAIFQKNISEDLIRELYGKAH